MPRILTVDDSRAVRTMVIKQVQELGFDVDEAEDGVQGLARLEEASYDLVLLDVTMPNLDGPGMLQQMRGLGNKTPVLMLTSESKKSIVATVMKEGVDDYILKPFKPEDLRAKILKSLKMSAPSPVAAPAMPIASVPPQATPVNAREMAGRQFVDVLVVDDMENVQKKLRSMLPERVTLNGAVSAQSALSMCKERIYRVIFVDNDIPDVNSAVLVQQLRLLQPHAVFIALALRSANDVVGEAKKQGFDGALLKPFAQDAVQDLLQQYFETQDTVQCDDNVVRINGFSGKEDRLDKYYRTIASTTEKLLEQIAAACFESAIIDITNMAVAPDRGPKLVAELDERSRQFGLQLVVVGGPEAKKMLSDFTETASLPFYESLSEARQAA